MYNKAFSQLTDAEKARKLDIAIRNLTDNLLTAEQIKTLVQGVTPSHQYSIEVHPVDREGCGALVVRNTLHIFVPEGLYRKETRNEQ